MAEGEWVSLFRIQELIYNYFDAVNRGDLDTLRSVFADDVVWEEPLLGHRQESADAYVEFFRESTAAAKLLVLTPHCPAIRLLGPDRAQATTTFHELAIGPAPEDGPFGPAGTDVNFEHYAIYYDDVAQRDGAWQFTHRNVVSTYMSLGAATGDVVTDRATLLTHPTSWTGKPSHRTRRPST